MIFYDGIYRLRSKDDQVSRKRKNWAYAWRVRLINLSISRSQVFYLKPFVVFVTPSGDGFFKATCAENLGKSVCRDFDLKIPRTLWVERFPNKAAPIMVARFIPQTGLRPDLNYHIDWREIRENECKTILSFVPETELDERRNF